MNLLISYNSLAFNIDVLPGCYMFYFIDRRIVLMEGGSLWQN